VTRTKWPPANPGRFRTFAWISRNRRLARDYERYDTTVAAFVHLAMIRIMLKRLTKPSHCS
jgi:putative transposase